ncbi:MAG: HlyC/CorC family transporter [Flavobacteriaceae bacterium]
MTTTFAIIIGAIFILLICSAFFSGSETALTAASRARMFQLDKNGDRRAGVVNQLLDARERLIGALLLGNNLVNILASSLATSLFLSLFGDAGVAYATLVMTFVVLVFSEILPKTAAITDPDRFALAIAPVVRVLVVLFAPVVMAIEAFVRLLLTLLGWKVDPEQKVLSAHEELRGAIDMHAREGNVIRDDQYRLGGVLDLRDLWVSDVMVHRTAIQVLNADDPPVKLVNEVLASSHTRLPLWRDKPENIVGVLHAKDLLRAIHANGGSLENLKIDDIATSPWFVPDTTSLEDQLDAFLKRKIHMALVVDEYGEVMGMLTLEDILEEIVGEISDEHDIEVQGLKVQSDGSVQVEGAVPIRDINRAMHWSLPDEEATTVAGLVINAARMIPDAGQVFTFYGFRFSVLRRVRNRLTLLHIAPVAAAGAVPPVARKVEAA